ncbi:F-box family protein [Striga asiatica]|uniref:F-box family protein n=1 Tax=Striga asiatica TaxID=4170 RepID=A0A5A7PV76_STRAF|nr:F-box family protein [Striga asiatica]
MNIPQSHISPAETPQDLGIEATANRPPETIESTGSFSITSPSPEEKMLRLTKMLASDEIVSSNGKLANAKWPPENEREFLNLLFDKFMKRNFVTGKCTIKPWLRIHDPAYDIKPLLSRMRCLEALWSRFHTMLTKETGYSLDASRGMITRSYRRRWIQLSFLQLCTLSAACLFCSWGDQLEEPISPELFSEPDDDLMTSPQSQRRRGWSNWRRIETKSIFNTTMHSLMELTHTTKKKVEELYGTESTFGEAMHLWMELIHTIKKKFEEHERTLLATMKQALSLLQAMPDLSDSVFKIALKNLHDPMSCEMFTLMKNDAKRRLLLEVWVEDSLAND